MRYPEFLKAEGTIGFVAPSFGCATEPYLSAFNNSLKVWKDMGYKTDIGPNAYTSKGIGISNTPFECAGELQNSYIGNGNDVIISCGGGELMCEILPYINFEEISKAKPKWYLGYSDNTNFTFLLTTICDVASLYGPCASSFGMNPWHKSLHDMYEVLTGKRHIVNSYDLYEVESLKAEDNPTVPYNCTEKVNVLGYVPLIDENALGDSKKAFEDIKKVGASANDVHMKGRIIGGCMDCLVNLLGTEFDHVNEFVDKYESDGIIWYLEACDLNVFGIRRAMWQMQNAGWFRNAKGFIFGRPANGEPMMDLDHINAVLPYTCGLNKAPTIIDADIGHRPPAMPIINGSIADVSLHDGELVIDMKVGV